MNFLNIEFKEDQILINGRDASGKLAVERMKKAQHRSYLEKWEKRVYMEQCIGI